MVTAGRLVPHGNELFLDHVGIVVSDHEAAAEFARRLGFTVTPFAAHAMAGPDGVALPSGTGNRCVMLREGYLELLAPVGEGPLTEWIVARLARHQGAHLIALAGNDPVGRHDACVARGLPMLPLTRLERRVATPTGESTARFTLVRLALDAMAEGRVQVVTHHTPELTWQPRFLDHDNAAEALTGLVVCVEEPYEALDRYCWFTGGPGHRSDGMAVLPLDRGHICFVTPDRLRALLPVGDIPDPPYVAAASLRSADIEMTRRRLAMADHPWSGPARETLRVNTPNAFGLTLVFHDREQPPLWDAVRGAVAVR